MSFESEYEILKTELTSELELIHKSIIPSPGRDDREGIQRNLAFQKYNKKLTALKNKYKIQ